ncbi:hypothetical protein DU508_15760 [Pedobacter chinensis]|uniref:Uncharacterized protein n=1 Tax=Pedobacter chinensis TaxID=2282421 RepID=A0A369PT76_9SPHI|nr:hypothetical protein DU508_15760 [Pedobacter chinensis]
MLHRLEIIRLITLFSIVLLFIVIVSNEDDEEAQTDSDRITLNDIGREPRLLIDDNLKAFTIETFCWVPVKKATII